MLSEMSVVEHPPEKSIGAKVLFGTWIDGEREIVGRKNWGGVLRGRGITREENMCAAGEKSMLFDRILEMRCHRRWESRDVNGEGERKSWVKGA